MSFEAAFAMFVFLLQSLVLNCGFLLIFYCTFAVAAVFSLAHKLQPAIIFIDEVDSFLSQRRTSDHEALTNMKTEFMALWDGFTTDREYFFFNKTLKSLSSFMFVTFSKQLYVCNFLFN